MDIHSMLLDFVENTELLNGSLDWSIVESLIEAEHLEDENLLIYPLDSDTKRLIEPYECNDIGYHPLSVQHKQLDKKIIDYSPALGLIDNNYRENVSPQDWKPTEPFEYNPTAYNSTVYPTDWNANEPSEHSHMTNNSTVYPKDWNANEPSYQNQEQNKGIVWGDLAYNHKCDSILQSGSDISRFAEPYVYNPMAYHSIQLKHEKNLFCDEKSTSINSAWKEKNKLNYPHWLSGNNIDIEAVEDISNTLKGTIPEVLFKEPGLQESEILTENSSEELTPLTRTPTPILNGKSQKPQNKQATSVDTTEAKIRIISSAAIQQPPTPQPIYEVQYPVSNSVAPGWYTNMGWSPSNQISVLSIQNVPALSYMEYPKLKTDNQFADAIQAAPSIILNGFSYTGSPTYPFIYTNYLQQHITGSLDAFRSSFLYTPIGWSTPQISNGYSYILQLE